MADGKVVIDIVLNDGSVVKGVADVGKNIRTLDGDGKKASIGIKEIASALGLVKIASKAIDILKNSLDKAMTRIDTMEQFERTMTVMTGSTELAQKALDELSGITRDTAYGLDVAAKSTQNFVTSGMDIGKATKQVEVWGDAVAFYGDGSNAQFASVTDALAKMTSAGKVQGDQLNRLTDAGIPAVQLFADATGKSVGEVRDQLSNGAIDADEFMTVMQNAMTEGTTSFASISGAAKDAGLSWQGAMDNSKAAIARGMTDVLQSIDEGLAKADLPSVREMMVEGARKIEGAIKKIAEGIGPVVEWLAELMKKIEPLTPLIIGLTTAIVAYAIAMKIKALIDGVTTAIQLFKVATEGATIAQIIMKAVNPFALIAAAVAGLVAAFIYFWNTNEDFRNAVIKAWTSIKETFDKVWTGIKTFFSETLPNTFKSIIDWFKNNWKGLLLLIVNPFAGAFKLLYDNNSKFKAWIDGIIKAFKEKLSAAWAWIKDIPNKIMFLVGAIAREIWDFATVTIPNAINKIVEWFKGLPERIQTWLAETLAKIAAWGVNTYNTAVTWVKDTINSIVNFFKELPGKIWNWLKEVITNIVRWGSDLWQKGKQAAIDFVTKIIDTVRELPEKMKQAGRDAIQGLIDGVVEMKDKAIGKVKELAGSFVAGFKSKDGLDIHSPSRVMKKQIGVPMAEGVIVGFEEEANNMVRTIRNFATRVATPLSTTQVVEHTTKGIRSGETNQREKEPVKVYFGDVHWYNKDDIIETIEQISGITVRKGRATNAY